MQVLGCGTGGVKSVHLFNEKLVHLVDELFWYMSFKNTKHAEKVLSSIFKLINVMVLIAIVLGQHCQQHCRYYIRTEAHLYCQRDT